MNVCVQVTLRQMLVFFFLWTLNSTNWRSICNLLNIKFDINKSMVHSLITFPGRFRINI